MLRRQASELTDAVADRNNADARRYRSSLVRLHMNRHPQFMACVAPDVGGLTDSARASYRLSTQQNAAAMSPSQLWSLLQTQALTTSIAGRRSPWRPRRSFDRFERPIASSTVGAGNAVQAEAPMAL